MRDAEQPDDPYRDLDREIWGDGEPPMPEPHEIAMALEEFRKATREMAAVLGDMAGMITERLNRIEEQVRALAAPEVVAPVTEDASAEQA